MRSSSELEGSDYVQASTCDITGVCPPQHVLDHHKVVREEEPLWDVLSTDIHNFSDEFWSKLSTLCKSTGSWEVCWTAVQGAVGWEDTSTKDLSKQATFVEEKRNLK